MTEEDTYRALDDLMLLIPGGELEEARQDDTRFMAALAEARAIIRRQLPRKPYASGKDVCCACGQKICDRDAVTHMRRSGYRYCPVCGRRIDWSEYNEQPDSLRSLDRREV